MSCSLNKLDVKNQQVLWDLENPQALSSSLAALAIKAVQIKNCLKNILAIIIATIVIIYSQYPFEVRPSRGTA